MTAWARDHHRKPLLLRGARQVGKTYAIEAFLKQEFANYLVVNFELTQDIAEVFRPDLKPDRIIRELELRTQTRIEPGRTCLFFDEIQACPEAITSLRYFYELRPDVHVIAAGSLIEFALQEQGIPVGRVDTMEMFPLSFDEFLEATGRSLLKSHRPSYSSGLPPQVLSPAAHRELALALGEYACLGGMPAVVARYLDSKSILEAVAVQKQLIRDFRNDIPKYAKGGKQVANAATVWQRIPRFVGQEITYSTLGEGDLGVRTAESVRLLELAMLTRRVIAASPAQLPLGAFARSKHFKLLHLDCGLFCAATGADIASIVSGNAPDLLDVFEGRLAEQVVGQLLLTDSAAASEDGQLYCWIRPQLAAKAEVDYLIVRAGKIIPVEVKKGATGRLRSLKVLLDEHPNVERAIVLRATDHVTHDGKITFAPLYTRLDS